MEPRLLILETSCRVGQVALALGNTICEIRKLDEARRHARDLAPAVQELLARTGWQPRSLDAVLVSRGPGSYTGLRVGIMSAKVLAFATGCKLLAIDTFAAIAVQAPLQVQYLDVLADAQQDRVYLQRFQRLDNRLAPATTLAIRPVAEWLTTLDDSVWVSGPGLRIHHNRLRRHQLVPEDLWEPHPESILHLGLERFSRGESDDFWAVEPLYLRPSAAEEKWKTRTGAAHTMTK